MPTLLTGTGLEIARRRLQSLADGLAEIDLKEEVSQAALLLRGEMPLLPDYPALPPEQQGYYDVAIGLSAATALLSPASLRANKGLTKLREGDEERTFAVIPAGERAAWAAEMAQATELLARYVRSLNPPKHKPAFSMFSAAGVARARQRRW